eukprot:6528958-Pyramimonas_sp.AAC.1
MHLACRQVRWAGLSGSCGDGGRRLDPGARLHLAVLRCGAGVARQALALGARATPRPRRRRGTRT